MTDALAGLATGTDAPADTPPATPAVDIEVKIAEVRQQLSSEFEDRIKGFQRLVSDKEKEAKRLQDELKEARMSGMTQDEKEALEWEQMQQENAQLKARMALLELQRDYPDEVPLFEQMLAASSPKDQLEMLRKLRSAQANPAAPATPPTTPADGGVAPPVDPNNPRSALPVATPGSPSVNGVPMTDELASQIFQQWGNNPARTR
jgi:Skp family chaperone for outer membrane proteins